MGRDATREAARLAQSLQAAATEALPSRPAPVSQETTLFGALVTDPELAAATRRLFVDGHYSRAVEEGYKFLNNLVKTRAGLGGDGAGMMTAALSPSAPVLKISALRTQSQKDQQQGYMRMLEGAMIGVRNPRAHDHRPMDDARNAIELLTHCNHLVRVVRGATRARRRKSM